LTHAFVNISAKGDQALVPVDHLSRTSFVEVKDVEYSLGFQLIHSSKQQTVVCEKEVIDHHGSIAYFITMKHFPFNSIGDNSGKGR